MDGRSCSSVSSAHGVHGFSLGRTRSTIAARCCLHHHSRPISGVAVSRTSPGGTRQLARGTGSRGGDPRLISSGFHTTPETGRRHKKWCDPPRAKGYRYVHERQTTPPASRSAPMPMNWRQAASLIHVLLVVAPMWGCAGRPSPAADPLGRYRALVEQVDDEIRRVEAMDCSDGGWKCWAQIVAIRYRLDQMVRNPAVVQGDCLGRLGFADAHGCHMGHTIHVDRSNRRFLKSFLRRTGSPFCSPLPPLAQERFWYLAQHLDDDPNGLSLRRRLADSLLCAVRNGTLAPWQYAAFIDRLRLMQHQLQPYGTQFVCAAKGARMLAAVSEKEIKANRKRIGMRETIAETIRRVDRNCGNQE